MAHPQWLGPKRLCSPLREVHCGQIGCGLGPHACVTVPTEEYGHHLKLPVQLKLLTVSAVLNAWIKELSEKGNECQPMQSLAATGLVQLLQPDS